VFLEQSNQLAAAGLVVRAEDHENMQRFLLDTDGPAVRVRVDTLLGGERIDEFIRPIETPRRGFSLRLVAVGPKLSCFLDGRLVYQGDRPKFSTATRVGLLGGGVRPSRLGNFEVRAAE